MILYASTRVSLTRKFLISSMRLPSRERSCPPTASNNMSTFRNGEILIVVGPRGELPGRCEEWDEACYGKLRKVFITHGKAVNSIQMCYQLKSGSCVYSHRRGGDGDKFDSITLEPWETLTMVSGHYGEVDGSGRTAVRSLNFVTNRTTYGPFGQEEGTSFSFNFGQPDVSFGGFHGRSGDGYLRAIGVYVSTSAKLHFEPEPATFEITRAWRSSSVPKLIKRAGLFSAPDSP